MNAFVLLLILGVGLVQLPMLVDVLVVALPSARLRRLTQRSLSVVLVSVVLALCLAALLSFYTVYLPELLASGGHDDAVAQDGQAAGGQPRSSATYYAHAAGITYLWLLTLDNYYHAATTRPPAALVRARRVPAFDHFCPFTMNHVWRDNFATFYAFLAGAALGTLYASAVSWPHFYAHWLGPLAAAHGAPDHGGGLLAALARLISGHGGGGDASNVAQEGGSGGGGVSAGVSLLFVAAFGLLQATGGLLLFQTYLLWRGWTTVTFFSALRADGGARLLAMRLLSLAPFDEEEKEEEEEEEEEKDGLEKGASKWALLTQRPLWAYLLPPSLALRLLPPPAPARGAKRD